MEHIEQNSLILVDDGLYFIERILDGDPETMNGFLMHRCACSLIAPAGYECVGLYQKCEGGKWRVSIDAAPDQSDESICLGEFESRMSAMAVLWAHRVDAFCRHNSQ